MYGQSCSDVGCGGSGPLRFWGASLCWGHSLTFHSHRSVGFVPDPFRPLGKVIHRLAKVLIVAADGEQRVQAPVLPRAPDLGVVRLVLPGVSVEARVVRGGGT